MVVFEKVSGGWKNLATGLITSAHPASIARTTGATIATTDKEARKETATTQAQSVQLSSGVQEFLNRATVSPTNTPKLSILRDLTPTGIMLSLSKVLSGVGAAGASSPAATGGSADIINNFLNKLKEGKVYRSGLEVQSEYNQLLQEFYEQQALSYKTGLADYLKSALGFSTEAPTSLYTQPGATAPTELIYSGAATATPTTSDKWNKLALYGLIAAVGLGVVYMVVRRKK